MRPTICHRVANEPPESPRFYQVAEAARMFRMSSMTLYRAISAGEFPAVRIRGRLIIPAEVVDAMVKAAMQEYTVVDAADFVPHKTV